MTESVDAWLLLTVGDNRQHGGNQGYEDHASCYYRWDSTVANHRDVAEGHRIVLWDKKSLIGASVIDEITATGPADKLLFRCPRCGMAGIKPRTTKTPIYHCYKCENEFDSPAVITKPNVTSYLARYEPAWTDLNGALDGDTLRRCAVSVKSQHSLRPLRWNLFASELAHRGVNVDFPAMTAAHGSVPDIRADRPDRDLVRRSDTLHPIRSGHRPSVVRARIGQGAFRRGLIHRFGSTCAFTGPVPPQALEAAHLLRYADHACQEVEGGLLMRRDIHALFDAGLVSVDAGMIRVHPDLSTVDAYRTLDGQPLNVTPTARQEIWLALHHQQALFARLARTTR